MTRSALPQDYIIQAGILYEDFETLGDWTLWTGTGTLEADTEHYKIGTQSLKITPSAANIAPGFMKPINQCFLNLDKVLTLNLYIPDNTAMGQIWVYLCTTSGMGKGMYAQYNPSSKKPPNGWTRLVFGAEDWKSIGGGAWTDTFTRIGIRYQSNASVNGSVSFDNLCFGQRSIPKLLFVFDDAYQNAYDNAYSYMVSKGLRGTFFPVLDWIGALGKVAESGYDTANDIGWCIGNHTKSHRDLSTLTESEIIAEVQAVTDWQISKGYTRGLRALALPSGGFNDLVISTLEGLGFNFMRTSRFGYNYQPLQGIFRYAAALGSALSLTTALSYIDTAKRLGATFIFYIHEITEAGGTAISWPTADFQTLINYAIASGISIVTADEHENGRTNPRYRSLSVART